MNAWIPEDTPILETVFLDVAPDALDIRDILACGLGDELCGLDRPLTYWELSDWTRELAK